MATFKVVLDKRTKLKGAKYNLAVRMVNGNDVMYINIQKMTENQYDKVFNNKVKDEETESSVIHAMDILPNVKGFFLNCNHSIRKHSGSGSGKQIKTNQSLCFLRNYSIITLKIKRISNPQPLIH